MKLNLEYNPCIVNSAYAPEQKNIAPVIIAGIIAAGAALAGGGASIAASNHANNKALAENEKNRQWQEDMYTKYNSPTARFNEMSNLGYNPNTILSGGQIGQGTMSSNVGVPNIQTPDLSSISQAGNSIADAVMQYDVLQSQAYKNYKEAGKSEAETTLIQATQEAQVAYQTTLASKTQEEQLLVKEQRNKLLEEEKLLKAQTLLTDTQTAPAHWVSLDALFNALFEISNGSVIKILSLDDGNLYRNFK